jgi:hypothetical protein
MTKKFEVNSVENRMLMLMLMLMLFIIQVLVNTRRPPTRYELVRSR